MATLGVVLAGGSSTRMGQNKAVLSWQGQPLVEHMRGILLRAGLTETVISGSGADCIPDQLQDMGPLAGIQSVLETMPGYAYLLVPVDMPLLPPALLCPLIDHPMEGYDAIHYAGQPFPLLLKDSPVVQEAIASTLTNADAGLRSVNAFLDCLRVNRPLSPVSSKYFFNANTPAQWQRCRELADEGTE